MSGPVEGLSELSANFLRMNCLRCGEVCRCEPEESSTALLRPERDASESLVPADASAPQETCDVETTHAETSSKDGKSNSRQSDIRQSPQLVAESVSSREENGVAWRDELTAKLSSYRARRKPRPPRYPSLRLRSESPNSVPTADQTFPSAPFETQSNQALALDRMMELPKGVAEWETTSPDESSPGGLRERSASTPAVAAPNAHHVARIIEFPRSAEFGRWEPALPPNNELAGPVMAAPRILEAPEVVPPAPALGGITIEAPEPKGDQRLPGIDVPLQAAPLARRMAAAAVDGMIILLATALFGLTFWKVTGIRPPLAQVLGLAVAVPCFLWAAYQYLLIVYAATTPGLRFAGLELARFDGTLANRRLRRWRVLASYLAAVSLGMGYVWVFLDEDALCWHDRITHTYLAPKTRRT